ncbi:MAG: hypothetical protein WC971_00200 [Coriobacteriia bacterium]
MTRRKALAKTMAIAAGAVAVTMLPTTAMAADSDNVVIGTTNEGSSDTVLISDTEGTTLQVDNTHVHDGDGGGSAGVKGTGFIGVRAESTGVKTFQGPGWGPMAVLGVYTAPEGNAQSRGVGVMGRASGGHGVGVQGDSGTGEAGPDGIPTWQQLDGTGVVGRGITRGVLASSTTGRALDVYGKACFSRSGRSHVDSGHTYADVTCANLATTSNILATLQGSGGTGVAVACCSRLSATTFRVTLTRAATRQVNFAWFVLG